MIKTILPQHGVSGKDRSILLHLTTLVALEDLREGEILRWRRPPPEGLLLKFSGGQIRVDRNRDSRAALTDDLPPERVDQAVTRTEEIFDRYHLAEEERDTLYTALPCLGLKALASWLEWREKPPFAELGN